jgi:MarC family membrane protein
MVCVTGVSGSGKSTLVHDTLVAALKKELGQSVDRVGRYQTLEGGLHVYDVEMVDQSPIGRSSRSNPATYSKAFDGIRDVFSQSKQAKLLGLSPGHFSFNVPGGRCEACQGEGVQTIEMQFMADIELVCEECEGARFRKEILQVKVDGHSIHDVLELSISDALELFKDHTSIHSRLLPMEQVGLGYLKLGQSATTLSGGEAQRVKLAKFLTKPSSEHTLYVFDEPTTGLHFEDVRRLLDSFHELVDLGHSVLLIEHNIDIMMASDWIIDLGPEGGFGGGKVIATGTPEEVMELRAQSHRSLSQKACGGEHLESLTDLSTVVYSSLTLLLATFASLFSVVNPLAAAPVFLSLTDQDSDQERNQTARKAAVYMLGILLTFLLLGSYIMSFFGINLAGIRIAGGLIIMRAAFSMLNPEKSGRKLSKEDELAAMDKEDVSFSPLAMPLLSGPGSIAVIIGFASQANNIVDYIIYGLAILLAAISAFGILRLAPFVRKWLGQTGLSAMTRMMGFIALAISVQFILSGISRFFNL